MAMTVRQRGAIEEQSTDQRELDRQRDLVHQAQAGDSEAFGQLYRENHRAVYRYILRRVGQPQVAEDFTQDTFVRALGAFERYVLQDRAFAAWLFTIARNVVADWHKSKRYQLEDLSGSAERVMPLTPAAGPGPDELTLNYLTQLDLLGLIGQCTERQQTVLIARFFMGLSIAETAAELGVDPSAAKAMQYRATQRLQRLVELRARAGAEVPV